MIMITKAGRPTVRIHSSQVQLPVTTIVDIPLTAPLRFDSVKHLLNDVECSENWWLRILSNNKSTSPITLKMKSDFKNIENEDRFQAPCPSPLGRATAGTVRIFRRFEIRNHHQVRSGLILRLRGSRFIFPIDFLCYVCCRPTFISFKERQQSIVKYSSNLPTNDRPAAIHADSRLAGVHRRAELLGAYSPAKRGTRAPTPSTATEGRRAGVLRRRHGPAMMQCRTLVLMEPRPRTLHRMTPPPLPHTRIIVPATHTVHTNSSLNPNALAMASAQRIR